MEDKLTAAEIIEEVVSNMNAGIEPLRYSTAVPSSYQIYLRSEDYERLNGIISRIVEEIKRALDEETERLNRLEGRTGVLEQIKMAVNPLLEFLGLALRTKAIRKIEKPVVGWQISVHSRDKIEIEKYAANDNPDDVRFIVESLLALPAKARYGAGNVTKSIKTARIKGASRKIEESFIDKPTAAREASDVARNKPKEPPTSDAKEKEVEATGDRIFALIRCQNEQDNRIFKMVKPQIVIGRGNEADVSLDTETSVSRRHLQLRYDEAEGKFYAKDISVFGTKINGEELPKRTADQDDSREVELPASSRIELAKAVVLDFESAVENNS